MFTDPMPHLQPQEYHTEPQPHHAPAPNRPSDYSAMTKIPEAHQSKSRETIFVNNASFSFEKDKLQSLKIGPSYQTDVNDENVQKLKNEILQKCKNAIDEYEKMSSILKTLSIGLLSMNIVEIIISFFMLLILSMKYVPSDQTMIWTSLTMLMCIGEIFSAVKAINSSQNKSIKEMKEFICTSKVFCLIFLLTCALLVLVLGGVILEPPAKLTSEQKGKLVALQGILMVITFLKLISQISFIKIGIYLNNQLLSMSGENVNILQQTTS